MFTPLHKAAAVVIRAVVENAFAKLHNDGVEVTDTFKTQFMAALDLETLSKKSRIPLAKDPKDPNIPKMPLSGWMRFRAEWNTKNPDHKTMAEASAAWKALTPEQQKSYNPSDSEKASAKAERESYLAGPDHAKWLSENGLSKSSDSDSEPTLPAEVPTVQETLPAEVPQEAPKKRVYKKKST